MAKKKTVDTTPKIVEEVKPTYTGVNKHITEDVLPVDDIKELEPVDGESPAHKHLREVYVAFRKQAPHKWELEKVALMEKLNKI